LLFFTHDQPPCLSLIVKEQRPPLLLSDEIIIAYLKNFVNKQKPEWPSNRVFSGIFKFFPPFLSGRKTAFVRQINARD